jgi:thiamine biosynthesis lipoprotein
MTSASRNSRRRARPLLGTLVEIALSGAAAASLDAAADAAFAAIAEVQRRMSFHDPESDVSRLNRAAAGSEIAVHPWTFRVLAAALDLHRRSRGLFDIAIAPALQARGLLPSTPGDAPLAVGTGSDAIALAAPDRVRFRDPALRIDLGGIAKGFAVDRAVEVLVAAGVAGGVVNAGGDLAVFGAEAHRVELRDPRDPRALLGPLLLQDAALATSGVRFDPWGGAAPAPAPIVDPRTRPLAPRCAAASVCAPSCMMADALTKVVTLAGEDAAAVLRHYGARALLVTSDGDLLVTADWHGAFAHAA